MRMLPCCSVLVSLVTGVGCVGAFEEPPATTTTSGAPDAAPAPSESDFDRELMQIATQYKTFQKINRAPYTSSLGDFQINDYVTGDVRGYRSVQPDTTPTTSTPAIAVGTVIVREVLDAQGQISKLTLMAKGPSGYDPTLGDWWFGEADPQGQPLVKNGVVRLGRLDDCHGCHVPRATTDYLFGVPKVDQTSH